VSFNKVNGAFAALFGWSWWIKCGATVYSPPGIFAEQRLPEHMRAGAPTITTRVPDFSVTGETIWIKTEAGEYMSRA